MRAMGARHLVGTAKGRLTKLERGFLSQPWTQVREGVQVKRLQVAGDTYVLARSAARVDKERAMRRLRLRRYLKRLRDVRGQQLSRDQQLMKLGAAKQAAGRAAGLVKVELVPDDDGAAPTLTYSIDHPRLRAVRQREGRYLLRTD